MLLNFKPEHHIDQLLKNKNSELSLLIDNQPIIQDTSARVFELASIMTNSGDPYEDYHFINGPYERGIFDRRTDPAKDNKVFWQVDENTLQQLLTKFESIPQCVADVIIETAKLQPLYRTMHEGLLNAFFIQYPRFKNFDFAPFIRGLHYYALDFNPVIPLDSLIITALEHGDRSWWTFTGPSNGGNNLFTSLHDFYQNKINTGLLFWGYKAQYCNEDFTTLIHAVIRRYSECLKARNAIVSFLHWLCGLQMEQKIRQLAKEYTKAHPLHLPIAA